MKRQIAVEVICFLFILLFVYAALNKLLDYQKFSIQIGQSPILTGFGSWLPAVVIGSELALAIMLMFSRLRLFALYGCFSVMIMFTVYIAAILNLGVFIPCSCGGVLEKLGWTEHLIFNCVFVMLALLGIILERSKDGGGTPRKRLVTSLSGSMVSSIAVVVGLIFFSGVLRDRRGSFLRLFPSHPVLEKASFDLGYDSYYIAGGTENSVYLGNYTAPLHMVSLNLAKVDTQHVKLELEGTANKKFWSVTVAVDSPYFYAHDGVIPKIFRGHVKDWYATPTRYDKEYFLDLLPIDSARFFIKSLDGKTGESMLGMITADSPYYHFDRNILEKQVDGFFCKDGTMLHNKTLGLSIYVYRYRNQYLLVDTLLTKVATLRTIDTVSKARIKVSKVKEEGTREMSAPPLTVNKRAATFSNFLLVQSALVAQNESQEIHKEASVIDVYALPSGKYQFSFYIYHFAGREPLRQFCVFGKTFVALFDNHIQLYSIREDIFMNKEITARVNQEWKTEHLEESRSLYVQPSNSIVMKKIKVWLSAIAVLVAISATFAIQTADSAQIQPHQFLNNVCTPRQANCVAYNQTPCTLSDGTIMYESPRDGSTSCGPQLGKP